MEIKTADLCDRFADRLQIGDPVFGNYGGRQCFGGPATTVKVFEDNSLVRQALEEPGEDRVLVVDGGGSMRCALVGDQLALLGQRNQWAGIIVYGAIRDSVEIAAVDLGVKALGCHPLRSVKRNEGQRDIPVFFGGLRIAPGYIVYADRDGIIVSEGTLQ
jgi:regulator of ribonuclease activity A